GGGGGSVGGSALRLEQAQEIRDAKRSVSDVKFSPDGKVLAVGAKDNSIYFYTVAQGFKLRRKFTKHNAGIAHLDFSIDSQHVRSTCSAYELLFCHAGSGEQKRAASLKDCEWATFTGVLGWPVQGVWPPCADGTDINALDWSGGAGGGSGSRGGSGGGNGDAIGGGVVATADDFGRVKLFRWPCVEKGARCVEYCGHSSHVTNVRWLSGGAGRLVSVGGNDRCIFQWRHTSDASGGGGGGSRAAAAGGAAPLAGDALGGELLLGRASGAASAAAVAPLLAAAAGGVGGGDEFMAVKPWIGAIVAPTDLLSKDARWTAALELEAKLKRTAAKHEQLSSGATADSDSAAGLPALQTLLAECSALATKVRRGGAATAAAATPGGTGSAAPGNDLELEWVHGYRSHDCRNNARYGANGEIVFHAAAVGIVLQNRNSSGNGGGIAGWRQRFCQLHSDDIVSLAVHPGGGLVATGQMGKAPAIHVWDMATMQASAALQGFHQKAVSQLAFSSDGATLASVGLDDDNSVAVYDWAAVGAPKAASATGKDKVLDCQFVPGSRTELVTVGLKTIQFWTIQ
ncbi:unnamed protein product, partial [Phaeothamnion confervicola]